ncbi:MAG: FliA/WhiG family RNA polymerase sigma factor [Desulfonauticus sp.]|nr:FliA/WhiG family RNA polymerase sigma factor [Desulfonauticus sp.]
MTQNTDVSFVSYKEFSRLSLKEQEQLIKKYASKIKIIALRLKSKLPAHISLEELISAGTLGLMEAFHNFDPKQKIKFDTFAEMRIKGAMLDELRKMDWFSRNMRNKMKTVEGILQQVDDFSDYKSLNKYLQEKTGFNRQEIEDILLALQNQLWLSLEEMQQVLSSDKTEDLPQEKVVKKDLIDKVAKLIKELNTKEQLVLSLYYVEELTMKEIARVLGLTEGRVSQIRNQALQKLKKKFKNRYSIEEI